MGRVRFPKLITVVLAIAACLAVTVFVTTVVVDRVERSQPVYGDGAKGRDKIDAQVIRKHAGILTGTWDIVCLDRAGNERWREPIHNTIVNSGINSMLGQTLHGDTQITAWYIGLVNNSGFTAFAAADTAASHSGWSEFISYSQTTRPAWSPGAAAGQSISNGTAVAFSITASATVKGIFLISNNTISGTTGTLFSEGAFAAGNQTVNNGDTLQITYTVSLSSS